MRFLVSISILSLHYQDHFTNATVSARSFEARTPRHSEYTTITKILGWHNKENILFTRTKPGFPVVWWPCLRDNHSVPETVTIGQYIFFTVYYPCSRAFKETMVFCCISFVGWICGWVNFIGLFVGAFPLFFVLALTYGDRLLLGRVLFDIPNFFLAITYAIVIDASWSTIFR